MNTEVRGKRSEIGAGFQSFSDFLLLTSDFGLLSLLFPIQILMLPHEMAVHPA